MGLGGRNDGGARPDVLILRMLQLHNDQRRAAMPPIDYTKIITIEAGKRSGQPCIRGMRMTVYDVLDYLAAGHV